MCVRPKIYGYTGCKHTGCVKPGSVKLAMSHLLHGEAAPWNRALQSPVPPWIQGLLRQDLSTLLWHVEQCTCIGWGGACIGWSCWPSLCHCSPPSLDPVCLTLFSNCHNCLLARHVILHDFYDTCNAWYMDLRPWVDFIRCSLNQSERLPTTPFDWGKLVYSIANQNPGLMWRALSK